jgi:hypothetical protein
VPRLTNRSLPPYSFVPGRNPHPVRDPRGHRYGEEELHVTFSADQWAACEDYLFAIDLFNAGFYWESHEYFEAVWHACQRTGNEADLMKGLIKLAAAGVKVRQNQPAGVHRHVARGRTLFAQVALDRPWLLGLGLNDLVRACDRLIVWAAGDTNIGWGNLDALLPCRLSLVAKQPGR